MTSWKPILGAFGGGVLKGDNFVRWAYVDEAGISSKEPYVTVAGIVLHADKHHRAIKERINALRDSLPPELGRGLIFHAKDIWHGNKDFHFQKWDAHGIYMEERRDLIAQLCGIPAEFGLPVVAGWVEKRRHKWEPLIRAKKIPNLTANRANYALAFGLCCIEIEAFMREGTEEGEVAHIVAENTNEMRQHAEWAYEMLERRDLNWDQPHGNYLPLERLAETPHFVAKNRSSILQVADAIAFVVNRHVTMEDQSGVGHCYEKINRQFSWPREVVAAFWPTATA